MGLKRENVGDHKVLYIRSSASEEFDAFDALGPMMQQALRSVPIKSSSISVLQQIDERNTAIEQKNLERSARGEPPLRLLDPKDPMLDMALARGFVQLNAENLRKDRSEQDALLGIKPIVSRRSARSAREQRRSERRVRW